jgi:hypothetical protein
MLDANEPPIAHSQITPYLGEHAFKSMSSVPHSTPVPFSQLRITDDRTRNIPRRFQSEKGTGLQAVQAEGRSRRIEKDRQRVSR